MCFVCFVRFSPCGRIFAWNVLIYCSCRMKKTQREGERNEQSSIVDVHQIVQSTVWLTKRKFQIHLTLPKSHYFTAREFAIILHRSFGHRLVDHILYTQYNAEQMVSLNKHQTRIELKCSSRTINEWKITKILHNNKLIFLDITKNIFGLSIQSR